MEVGDILISASLFKVLYNNKERVNERDSDSEKMQLAHAKPKTVTLL